jgi:hypothetical protein
MRKISPQEGSMKTNTAIICSLVVSSIAAIAGITACSKAPHYELSRFVSPETCGGCHTEIYTQWKGSMHRLSQTDRLYLGFAHNDLKGLTESDEIAEAESCVKCHVPVGVITGYPKKLSDDAAKIPELANKGVQCDLCHSSTGAKKLYNAALTYEPGNGETDPGVKRGPRKDSHSDYHKTTYSEFHTGPEICAACHDVRHVVYGTKLETPYEEWAAGPYNSTDPAKRLTCQECHMRQRPGVPSTGSTERPDNPGKSAVTGPDRPHVFTHYFAGANTVIPDEKAQLDMAAERLKHAAVIVIGDAVRNGKISVTVKNTGAGHKIPTGLMHFRRAWLEIAVTDGSGKRTILSGGKDSNGYLNEKSILYTTVFGDGRGNPVTNIAKAREVISDRRISPGGEITEQVSLPEMKGGRVVVEARLLYCSGPQRLVDQLFGRGKMELPVTEMAAARKTIGL